MVNNVQELKEKMIEKYEQYKRQNRDNDLKVIGFQDCVIELLKLLCKEDINE